MTAVVTLLGQAKIAAAIAEEEAVELSRMVIGDGLGSDMTPNEAMTDLVNEVYDIQLTSVTRDEDNPNWIICEATIAEDVGPFTIREVGIQDADGALFAVSNYPATVKYVAGGEGIATAIVIRVIIVVLDTANVTIVLNPSDFVVAARRIDTGAGLTGGGDLTTDREHEIDWNTLPTEDTVANEDTIAMRINATGQHVQISRENFIGEAILSGDGLTGGTNVGTGDGALVKGVSGTNLQVRKIKSGNGITVAVASDDVVVGQSDYGTELTATTFAPATNKFVTASTTGPASEVLVDSRVALSHVLKSNGFADIQFGNSAPGDNTKLWWHTAEATLKRYNPLVGGWAAMTELQFSLWMHRKLIAAAASETTFADDDAFIFHDTSAAEGKKITGAYLKDALRGGWQQYGATVTIAAPTDYAEFNLPPAYRDFYLVGPWTSTGSGTKFAPRVIGYYVGGGTIDIGIATSSTFTAAVSKTARGFYSGDRGDLTGFITRTDMAISNADIEVYDLSGRIEKIRYQTPSSAAWQFATATLKLFVR